MAMFDSMEGSGRHACALIFFCFSLIEPRAHAVAADRLARNAAAADARAGYAAAALQRLKAELAADPADTALRADTVIVANWAGDDAYALQVFDTPPTPRDNIDVLEAAARSARNLKQYVHAAELFAAAVAIDPARLQARAGQAVTLAESGADVSARRSADDLLQRYPGDRRALLAAAYVQRVGGHDVDALALYQRIAQRWPDDAEARDGMRNVLLRLHAAYAAAEHDADAPTRDRIVTGRVAELIRSGPYQPADVRDRRADARAALMAADANLTTLPVEDREQRVRARLDRLVALRNLERMRDVVDAARSLHDDGVDLPPYARTALADAWLYLREPKRAIVLYREVLAEQPNDREIEFSLMYAYLEAEDFKAARSEVDHLLAAAPAWLQTPGLAVPQSNPVRARADISLALLWSFGDRLGDAQQRLEQLIAEAPTSAELHRELASVYLRRGWPLRARDEFAVAQSIDSAQLDDVAPALDRIAIWRALHEYPDIEPALTALEAQQPTDLHVQRARAEWDAERGWQFDIESHAGRGASDIFGNRDDSTTATLASPLIDDAWRVFAQTQIESAQIPEGDVDYRRAGLGLRYTQDALDARVVVLPSSDHYASRTALEAQLRWQFDDQWWAALQASSASADIPLRARWYGITASDVAVAAGWRRDDLSSATLRVTHDDFSDGNQRDSADLAVRQRLITEAHFKLDGTFELATSQNSRDGAPYFNPSRDAIALGGLEADWLTWRSYERNWHQRAGLAIGDYWEGNDRGRSYGDSAVLRLFYEHEWQLSSGLGLRYGIAFNRQDYDGERQSRREIYAALHWGGMP